MKKYAFPLTLIAMATSSIAQAIEVTANPFGTVNATISASEPNVIHVKNDRINSLSAKYGAVIQEEQLNDGSAMFSTTETKPFSVLIETEKGFTFTLNANPNKTANSSSVVIYNLADKGNEIEDINSSLARYQSYSGLITYVLTELLNNRLPDGFVETRKRSFDVPDSVKNVFKVRNTDAWVGQNMRVVKLELTNVSTSAIELNERYLWNKGVMAIQYDPKVTNIRPNTRVFAYVVLREVK